MTVFANRNSTAIVLATARSLPPCSRTTLGRLSGNWQENLARRRCWP